MDKKTNDILDFDFGFTLVDENDLENVKAVTQDAEERIEFHQDQVTKMYDLIQPLLANLEKNPELDYIVLMGKLEKYTLWVRHHEKISFFLCGLNFANIYRVSSITTHIISCDHCDTYTDRTENGLSSFRNPVHIYQIRLIYN